LVDKVGETRLIISSISLVPWDAEYLVRDDAKHVLPLEQYQGIEIVSPAGFVAVFSKGK
jgi:hypothetical protein